MRTSEQIYHRVRWDSRFDPARFVFGIAVRGAEPKRVPLPSFVPGGDVPWHRVLFVEADGELVWDRATGVDRIDSSEAGRARAPRRLRAPFFTESQHFSWDGTGWGPGGSGGVAPQRLRVLTWNTLWDRYDRDRIDTASRRPLLLADLARADADVIALQEVERDLLAMLLAEPWVRERYAVDAHPSGREVDDCGLLLLSRVPVLEAGRHAFGPHKAVTALVVETATGPVMVSCTHLTSDHTERGARRSAELADLAEGLSDVDCPLVLLGDFNDGTDLPGRTLGVRDAWTEVHGPADDTPTFDPRTNPLAAISSLSGQAARLDRVFLRGNELRPQRAVLRGTSALVSDHYGVEVDVELREATSGTVLDVPPTSRTAVAWLPPTEVTDAVDGVRRRHDPAFDRWPAHVNLLFGFVPEAEFDRAVALLAEEATGLRPFTARLDGVRSFDHGTVWLDPAADGPEPWAALRNALARRFPGCQDRGRSFTPHLTVGRAVDPGRLGPFAAEVGEVVVLSRRGDEPMRPRATIALGSGEVRWHASPGTEPRAAEDAAENVAEVVELVSSAFPDGVVHVVGSRRMGCALAGADLDLVAVVPGEVELDRVVVPGATGVRPVVGARVPGLRLRVGEVNVDLAVVGSAVDPTEAVSRRAELEPTAAVALSAVSDAEAILTFVGARREAFTWLASRVKAWARARGLDAAPHGGLPGLAWAVLAALTVVDAPRLAGRDLLAHFFGTWAAWDWRDQVTLSSTVDAPAAVSVVTPSAPFRLCTEQVGEGMRDLVTQELYDAWEVVQYDGDPWAASPPLHRRHAAWAVVEVRGDDLDAITGRVRGRMRALLTALEAAGVRDAHAWPRPAVTGDGFARYAIGLGRTPPDQARLRELVRGWATGLPGVTVEWVDGGAVPTLR
ncbi:poly(A) polymerase [Streptoalloteichus hindustanus]|uniref:Poly(A) polymerase central domain-containing protein n=1 Tax=Streptoalloteichus hindustanus TaxID=2017 RepID=A0A1M5I3N1_STRHI|nr:poly(A) polymerase [Streptoalloteichus hindustanus]SHG22896.1 Poly(A) polymerase central domain-containing protein [Streptoalloteichus hindustanus]